MHLHKWFIHMISWQLWDSTNWILHKRKQGLNNQGPVLYLSIAHNKGNITLIARNKSYRPRKEKADFSPFPASVNQLQQKEVTVSKAR